MGLSALETLVQRALPLSDGVPLQARLFGFLLGVSTASALLFGLVPALKSTRDDPRLGLAESAAGASASASHHRLRSALVVVELALSLILLVGAGLPLCPPGLAVRATPSSSGAPGTMVRCLD